MRITLIFMALMSSSAVFADDAADLGAKAYATKGCIGCHGPAGKSPNPTMFPVLAGRDLAYVSSQLTAFRDRKRNNPMMTPMAAGLSDEDIANIAAYLSAQAKGQ